MSFPLSRPTTFVLRAAPVAPEPESPALGQAAGMIHIVNGRPMLERRDAAGHNNAGLLNLFRSTNCPNGVSLMRYLLPAHLSVRCFAGLLSVAGLFASAAQSQDVTITDPAKGGRDFAIQGEYVGKIDDGTRHGVHIIALGDGKFEIVHYVGGLPGDGWKKSDNAERTQVTIQDDGVTLKSAQGARFILKDGQLEVYESEGKKLGTLGKVERKSPTLGAKPAQGAIVLFSGDSADHFEGGKLSDDGYLEANCTTKEKFGDCTFHIEFRTPFKPFARGQARGNSGVYAQSRYEIQVLDSFGLEGKNNECGGIYSIAEPAVNMCFPPLSWQTYDIDFTAARYEDGKKVKNARITIKHNGVVIHDDLELTKGTPGKAAEGPGDLGWYLQGHGNPVVFRNIWAVKK